MTERIVPPDEPGLVKYTRRGLPVLHGGSGMGYRSYGCRCRACKRANTERATQERINRQARLAQADVPHGAVSTYANWGCRCRECTGAQAAKSNRYYRDHLSAAARAEHRVVSDDEEKGA